MLSVCQVAASICEWICERLSDYHNNFSKDTALMRVRHSTRVHMFQPAGHGAAAWQVTCPLMDVCRARHGW